MIALDSVLPLFCRPPVGRPRSLVRQASIRGARPVKLNRPALKFSVPLEPAALPIVAGDLRELRERRVEPDHLPCGVADAAAVYIHRDRQAVAPNGSKPGLFKQSRKSMVQRYPSHD